MRNRRLALGLATTAAAALAVVPAGPAGAAAPASPAGTVKILADGPQGNNRNVNVYTRYTGRGYEVWAEFDHTKVQDGHLDVWGPGLPRSSSPNGVWPAGHDTDSWSGYGDGQVCAEGWSRIGGKWYSVGLPCVTIG